MPSTSKIKLIQQPSQLYDAIIDYFKTKLSAGDSPDISVDDYQNFMPRDASARQLLLEISSAENTTLQNDGRIAQEFACTLYAVISKAQNDAGLQAMNLASAIARRVHLNSWGYSTKAVEYPMKIELSESFLIKGGDQHAGFEAWEITWQQVIKLGEPALPPDPDYPELIGDPLVTGIFLAVNPVDSNNIDQYKDISEQCLSDGLSKSVSTSIGD
jgi:hypothetical protein